MAKKTLKMTSLEARVLAEAVWLLQRGVKTGHLHDYWLGDTKEDRAALKRVSFKLSDLWHEIVDDG